MLYVAGVGMATLCETATDGAVAGVNLGHLWGDAGILEPQMRALLRFARQGRVKPRVDRTFPVEEAAAAHRYLHERRNIGKVVLTF